MAILHVNGKITNVVASEAEREQAVAERQLVDQRAVLRKL